MKETWLTAQKKYEQKQKDHVEILLDIGIDPAQKNTKFKREWYLPPKHKCLVRLSAISVSGRTKHLYEPKKGKAAK